ncbi:hypothetical protein DCAR_0519201 [Daucus carota subsp. sativus]|uniref:Uncharacterized protein n=1 Tax=Daucus carota subsp. sativus TaxID=79200 RepID=A0A164XSS0_DAUCS|nr:PREDICTED: outer envelope pore protein 21B, chloroplastic [Daucus carota subsp. sativus]WOG99845.1 hypothetical protein DCAR_0519201 [Daucus carota subsp. sativus]
METSLRYGGDSKILRIRAKEKIPFDSETHLELHGELDTKIGAPSFLSGTIRHFYPDLLASLGLGVQYDKRQKLRYVVRGKKEFPVTADGMIKFHVKGRCDIGKDFIQRNTKGHAELTWDIFNFRKDQDVRLKIGYEVSDKIPYLQIRENNWTFNADVNGKWNVRYDL